MPIPTQPRVKDQDDGSEGEEEEEEEGDSKNIHWEAARISKKKNSLFRFFPNFEELEP